MKKRYCGMCDDMTNANPCEQCGAATDLWPKDAEPDDPDGEDFRGGEAAGFHAEQQAHWQRFK